MAARGHRQPVPDRRPVDHRHRRDPAQAAADPAPHPRDRGRRGRRQARRAGHHRQPGFHASRRAPRARGARRTFRSSTMRRPRSGPGGRGARARCARYVDEVLAILPFEPAAFARLGGPPCTYVGHPLAERIGGLRPNAGEAGAGAPIRRWCWCCRAAARAKSAGSRRFSATAIAQWPRTRRAVRAGAADAAAHCRAGRAPRPRDWPVRPRIVIEPAEKHAAFRAARAALAASGTVDARTARSRGVPMVAAYRGAAHGKAALFRLLATASTPSILANLVLGENVVPEYLQRDCTPERPARRRSFRCSATRRSGGASSMPSRASTRSWTSPASRPSSARRARGSCPASSGKAPYHRPPVHVNRTAQSSGHGQNQREIRRPQAREIRSARRSRPSTAIFRPTC